MSDNKDEFNFSKSFSKLEEITESLEDEDLDLDKGIKKFEEGLKLAEKLKERLDKAENRVEKIKADFEDLDQEE